MKLVFAVLGLLFFTFGAFAQDYSCEKLKSNEITQKSYSAIVVIKEDKTFQVVKGIAQLNEKPLENVFVEVFTDKNPNRIDGCKTGANGRFSFPNLKKGNYTLRLSKDSGYRLTEIKIKVSPKSKNKNVINGEILLGV